MLETAVKQPAPESDFSRRLSVAESNRTFMMFAWCIVFTLAAVYQVIAFPDNVNLLSVLFAWCGTMCPMAFIFRRNVLFRFPWSATMVLMYCLASCGGALVLISIQGESLSANLEVPSQAFFHLFMCNLALGIAHACYRNLPTMPMLKAKVRDMVWRPFGLLSETNFTDTFIIGFIGFVAFVYLAVIRHVGDDGGDTTVTGSAFIKFAAGISCFTYAPFVLVCYPANRLSPGFRQYRYFILAIYFVGVLFLAMAFNVRSLAFQAVFVVIAMCLLYAMVGEWRIRIGKLFVYAVVAAILAETVGADLSTAMRIARNDRSSKTSIELISDTFDVLVNHRDELDELRTKLETGDDLSETWYVKNALLSRFVVTHFNDRALSICLNMRDSERDLLWRTEFYQVIGVVPEPLLKIVGLGGLKDQYNSYSIGDLLMWIDGRQGSKLLSGFSTGGMVGDGYILFGWAYVPIFAGLAIIVFAFTDSFYNMIPQANLAIDHPESRFGMVTLINSYAICMCLCQEAMCDLFSFIIRIPLQWVVLYMIVFWIVLYIGLQFRFPTFPKMLVLDRGGGQGALRRMPGSPGIQGVN
jgi:hypothetical protein